MHTGGAITSCRIDPDITTNTGLTFNQLNCAITGKPSIVAQQETTYKVYASNIGNNAATASITVQVVAEKPSALVYSPMQFTYTVDEEYVGDFPAPTASGGAITGFTTSPNLPAGLTISTTGTIVGAPTDVLLTSTEYTVTASNSGGTATASIYIQVVAHSPTGLSYARSGDDASYTLRLNTAASSLTPDLDPVSTRGGGTITYTIAPALPAGLEFSASTGTISGTPTVLQYPAKTYVVNATNSGGVDNATVAIAVLDHPVTDLTYPYSGLTNGAGEYYPTLLGQYTITSYQYKAKVAAGTSTVTPNYQGQQMHTNSVFIE